ncbi:DNA-repair protein UmuC-like protein [Neofusicoccum parvum]|uniref:DNA-repair protein UmuC-like protein n=1 Tax=Neofusicoccum parvum TaxID=310453 RepID=A0ACB5RV22_9PEZI|nr:DNA-repair protein UmuC-like protein [Neofusicoccum parvum]GME40912.1 DNA-repair protein UmuC-like protein [Neofusicoccum parvum]
MGSRLENTSNAVRKRIENHTFDNEEGEEYEASNFGGFAEYFRRKAIKLQNLDAELRSQSVDNPQIFRGVVAHVNGYTQPSLNDLHKLIVTHGGGYIQYLHGKTTVTHIIASSLTPKKAVEFRNYRIVKPAWVVDSVKAGKLLPWDNYRVVDEGAGQKVLGFEKGKVNLGQQNSPW